MEARSSTRTYVWEHGMEARPVIGDDVRRGARHRGAVIGNDAVGVSATLGDEVTGIWVEN
jgi:hypothetical protein